MLVQHIIFYVFAILAITSAGAVILSNNPVRSALFLVMTFFASAGIWMLAHAEFLALILVLVYVGAVMTLFLFVVMMLNTEAINIKRQVIKYLPLGILIIGLLVFLTFVAIKPENFGFEHLQALHLPELQQSNVESLGEVLYTQYALPFEVAAVLLLIAIISAISLAFRGSRECKSQDAVRQIRVRRADRVRLVKMKSESED
ncbi:MAG: NADH-quinone oxidoreductase subunit J [Gammaproteobacteria bacterium]